MAVPQSTPRKLSQRRSMPGRIIEIKGRFDAALEDVAACFTKS
jgi:threonine synthase